MFNKNSEISTLEKDKLLEFYQDNMHFLTFALDQSILKALKISKSQIDRK